MISKRLTVAAAAAIALSLAGCGSDTSDDSATETTGTTVAAATSCPTGTPAADASPTWTTNGTTGSLAVVAPTDTTAPKITVTPPLAVAETQVHTLTEGSGAVVPDSANVSVCYVGVNGRDGSTFDSAYSRGTPAEFALGQVVPGFQKAIAGQKVGSSVAVAMTSADGYPRGNPNAGINAGDSLVFVLQILSAN